jgi:hypothetical protein
MLALLRDKASSSRSRSKPRRGPSSSNACAGRARASGRLTA